MRLRSGCWFLEEKKAQESGICDCCLLLLLYRQKTSLFMFFMDNPHRHISRQYITVIPTCRSSTITHTPGMRSEQPRSICHSSRTLRSKRLPGIGADVALGAPKCWVRLSLIPVRFLHEMQGGRMKAQPTPLIPLLFCPSPYPTTPNTWHVVNERVSVKESA